MSIKRPLSCIHNFLDKLLVNMHPIVYEIWMILQTQDINIEKFIFPYDKVRVKKKHLHQENASFWKSITIRYLFLRITATLHTYLILSTTLHIIRSSSQHGSGLDTSLVLQSMCSSISTGTLKLASSSFWSGKLWRALCSMSWTLSKCFLNLKDNVLKVKIHN